MVISFLIAVLFHIDDWIPCVLGERLGELVGNANTCSCNARSQACKAIRWIVGKVSLESQNERAEVRREGHMVRIVTQTWRT
ncbi:hypothetical protein L218DRAFT_358707 [Marasmius fiardii PR-910]|nr:hypothetical protein L218DRAFT_358707 [Marasmius fiardii PR-910]